MDELTNWVHSLLFIDFIDFHLGRLHISPRGYRQVQDALEARRIRVIFGTSEGSAHYNNRNNTITISQSRRLANMRNDGTAKALIVHEATHAICDINHARNTTPLSEEVAGYLAQIIYAEHHGIRLSDSDPRSEAIFREAKRVCELHHVFNPSMNTHLKRSQYAELRQIILAHPLYAHYGELSSENDGVSHR